MWHQVFAALSFFLYSLHSITADSFRVCSIIINNWRQLYWTYCSRKHTVDMQASKKRTIFYALHFWTNDFMKFVLVVLLFCLYYVYTKGHIIVVVRKIRSWVFVENIRLGVLWPQNVVIGKCLYVRNRRLSYWTYFDQLKLVFWVKK